MSARNVQQAVDFLLGLRARKGDGPSLPATIDYGALASLAKARGFGTDEAALQQAFALIMRARLIASSA
jgi:hypothetical protein